jgi:excisionase family DNA binding protein
MALNRLYTVSEVAELTGLSVATLRSWIFYRQILTIRLGRCVRIPQDELDRIIRDGTTPRWQAANHQSNRLRGAK